MENETELIDFEILNEILNDESDDGDVQRISPPKKKCCSAVDVQLRKLNQLKSEQNLSNKTTEKIAKLLNSASNDLRIPQTKKEIQKSAAENSEIEKPIVFVFCESCECIVLNGELCSRCKMVAKKESKKDNFMVYFALIPQVKRLVELHFDEIMKYKKRNRDCLTDIDDGKLFQNISESLESNLIALTLNVDGATLSNSGGKQLWPVQMYLNCLPPKIRYKPENIIITTLFFSKKKPSMSDLLYPLCKELECCDIVAIQRPENELMFFLVRILIFSCDSPARTAIQNFIGPIGYYGCPYCYAKGVPVKNISNGSTIRYPKQQNIQLRTHNETINLMKKAENGCKTDLKGIKGVSCLLGFPSGYDIINSFCVDYMHGIALGISKDLIKIWVGKRSIPQPPYAKYKLSTKNCELLNSRILQLKPTSNFRRMPRSILDISDFKASEVMDLVFYYLRYSIIGLLESKIVKHFEKLSAGCYILCKETISEEEKKRACDLLTNFADEYEEIYGTAAITMNIHLLKHYYNMVNYCGPLWAYSLFGFENHIGVLKSSVNGTTDYLDQISKNYAASRTNSNEDDKPIKIRGIELKNKSYNESENLTVWTTLIMNGSNYSSLHSKPTKSIDYFIETTDKKIGKIMYYFEKNTIKVFLLHIYTKSFENYHWAEVDGTDDYKVYDCREIGKKLLYFKVGVREWITQEPNRFTRSR